MYKAEQHNLAKNSLKSLRVQNPPPTSAVFTPIIIRNGFIITF